MKSRERLAQLQQKMRQQAGRSAPKRGRPRLPIDPLRVAELAMLGLHNKDIAARLPCDRKTLRRFAPELERGRARRQAWSKLQEFAAATQGDAGALGRLLRQANQLAAGSCAPASKSRNGRGGRAVGRNHVRMSVGRKRLGNVISTGREGKV